MVRLEGVSEVTIAVSSFPPAPESLAPVAVMVAEVLNRHPLGAVRIRVPVALKSLAAVSVITMLPSVVNDGKDAFWAVSAEMFVPPVAAVMLTAPCAPATTPSSTNPRARRPTVRLAPRRRVPALRVRPNSGDFDATSRAAFLEIPMNFIRNVIDIPWKNVNPSSPRARV